MSDNNEPPVSVAPNTILNQPASPGRQTLPGSPVRPSASVAAITASTAMASSRAPEREEMIAAPSDSTQSALMQEVGDQSETTVEIIRSSAWSVCERDEKAAEIVVLMPSHPEVQEPSAAVPSEEAVSTPSIIDQRAEAMVVHAEAAEEPSWESPDESLLADVDIPEPPLPSLFSDVIQNEIQAIARLRNAPAAYVLASLLAVMAACLGHKMWFAAGTAWHEVCVVWSILVGPSGLRKSGVSRPYAEALREFERNEALESQEWRRKVAHDKLIADVQWQIFKADLSKALRNGTPLPTPPESKPITLPRFLPEIIADDFSIPALVEKHAASLGGLIIISDEVNYLLKRVGSEGGTLERIFLLRAHDGGFYRSNRVTRTVPTIDSLAISILGGIPTDRLRQVLGPVADGFAARCLWIDCDDSAMIRIAREDTKAQFAAKVLSALRALASEADEQIVMSLDLDGIGVLEEAAQRWQAIAGARQGQIGSWYARAAGQALRLAGLRELCEWALTGNPERPQVISAVSMLAAVNAVDTFFAPMAQRVLGAVGGQQASHDAAELARFIAQDGEPIINRRLLQRDLPKRLKEKAVFRAAFNVLEKGSWVRPVPREKGERGRSRADYEVNPRLISSLD